ncbi:rod shape-determining protein MreD [Sphingomonas xanthus]|uniref:Rod shape-determining protein MreD n=1 Tax=Sphingomonas xanthus TaxID=2594473 RepID=A0A516IP75_9SPHN|nr:rod shape-determining protein MreD [Sphingomonas xanthus]QDP18687.1 rod shape-determining protein MreD [Sphingomonas xanthus]
MVRSALGSKSARLNRGPRPGAEYWPAATVMVGALLSLLPIVSATGWWPDFGLQLLVAWRLLRADAWPAWWAAPMGLANDLILGNPIGLSMVFWPAIMIAMDILDRRTMWRDYWVEWAIAALFLAMVELAQWQAAAMLGAPVPLKSTAAPAIIVAVLVFPVTALIVTKIDRWRLGR